jgi:tRNA 2-thiouridine synthesizing protein A
VEQKKPDKTVNTSGQSCPIPIVECNRAIKTMQPGQVLELISTDIGSRMDISAWCQRTGHELVHIEDDGKIFRFYVRKRDWPVVARSDLKNERSSDR